MLRTCMHNSVSNWERGDSHEWHGRGFEAFEGLQGRCSGTDLTCPIFSTTVNESQVTALPVYSARALASLRHQPSPNQRLELQRQFGQNVDDRG